MTAAHFTFARGSAIAMLTFLRCASAAPDCAACHQAIYDQYRQTPMANSSGATGGGLIRERYDRAVFDHAPTGFRYRVGLKRGSVVLEFAKIDGSLKGTKELPYFVGSGATARSYLVADDGFLYQAPVAYYTSSGRWGLAPNYETYAYPYLTRPAVPGCLTCHASFLNAVPRTQNRYGSPPFGEGGIACERCHGAGETHIRKMQSGDREGGLAIVNPAKLPPERRDSVCSQCHLTGEVRVMRAGQDWQSYRLGDRLADSVSVFVRAGDNPGLKVTSHVEKLAQSACKRGAGDGLWCGTCHDPHSVPKPAERAAWFRQKCLGCHDTGACRETKAARARRQDDCIACHMTKSAVTDAQHVVYTDHSIPRRPRSGGATPPKDLELVAFGGGDASPRDVALAYGIAASRTQDAALRSRAMAMLQETERNSPNDVEVLLYLAELYRNGQQEETAIPLYQRAIRLDPAQVTASVGLGGILMERGQFAEAVRLWEDALSKNGGLELVRINMALAEWRSGDLSAAEAGLVKAVALNPGFATPVELLQKLREQLRQPR
jgi:ssDNA-binding Zn-finger/Zn-ribbon topoisomerase 1